MSEWSEPNQAADGSRDLRKEYADRLALCIDCGRWFDPQDDDARCPASDGVAYHRTEE
jgi:hypothetical protein